MKLFERLGVLLTTTLVIGCNQRQSECETVVGSMRALGRRLAVAQRETSQRSANAQQVSSALRTFAQEATSTGETLATSSVTLPELRRIASEASRAALSLADAATRMVNAAERMKGLEAARGAVRIQRTLADVAEAKIDRLCLKQSKECVALSKVLLSRPAFPESSAEPERTASWNVQVTTWIDQLSAVELKDPELRHQVANLAQTTKSLASALSTFSAITLAEKELAVSTKMFSSQIDSANAALTAAREFCKG